VVAEVGALVPTGLGQSNKVGGYFATDERFAAVGSVSKPMTLLPRPAQMPARQDTDAMNIATRHPDDPIAMFGRGVPEDLKDIIKGELAHHGHWLVANVSTDSFWPINPEKVRWRGVDIWIMPVTRSTYPALAMQLPPGKSVAECQELLLRFLSTLSWVEERGFMVEGGVGGGNLPRPMGRFKEHGLSICDGFDLSYFPEVTDADAMLALGLMREGRGLNHAGYAFLTFYRVLEVAFPHATKRVSWISASLSNLTGFGVKDVLAAITAQGVSDIGKHLYESGRCAMAHANRQPIIDPDKPDHMRRLSSELPIMRELAAKAIEEVFGVETSATNFSKHLYELQGFKEILGPDIVRHMQAGTTPPGQPTLQIPDISVRIRRKERYAPLEGLRCQRIGQNGKLLHMHFASLQADVEFAFSLDFGAERIEFDLFSDIGVCDTGSADSAERVHGIKRFEQDYFCNGQLQIFNTDTDTLIGRKDAYLPLNMMFNDKAAAAELAHWKAEAERRRERDRRYGEALQQNALGYAVTVDGPKTA
jgi:hypothetical protein